MPQATQTAPITEAATQSIGARRPAPVQPAETTPLAHIRRAENGDVVGVDLYHLMNQVVRPAGWLVLE